MKNVYQIAAVDFGALTREATPNAPSDIGGLISKLLTLFFPIAGFALLGYLIYAGYQYMFSAGDPKMMAKAQQGITYAIVGFVVISTGFIIVNFFGAVLDIQQIQDIF